VVVVQALADALEAVYADPDPVVALPAAPWQGPEAQRARALYRRARTCAVQRGVSVRETGRLPSTNLGRVHRGRITIRRTLPPLRKLEVLYHECAHALFHCNRTEQIAAAMSPTHRRAVEVHAHVLTACALAAQEFDTTHAVWHLRALGCRPVFLRTHAAALAQAGGYLLEWTSRDAGDLLPPGTVVSLTALFGSDGHPRIPTVVASTFLDATPLPLPSRLTVGEE
jgi:hypothetical protein